MYSFLKRVRTRYASFGIVNGETCFAQGTLWLCVIDQENESLFQKATMLTVMLFMSQRGKKMTKIMEILISISKI